MIALDGVLSDRADSEEMHRPGLTTRIEIDFCSPMASSAAPPSAWDLRLAVCLAAAARAEKLSRIAYQTRDKGSLGPTDQIVVPREIDEWPIPGYWGTGPATPLRGLCYSQMNADEKAGFFQKNRARTRSGSRCKSRRVRKSIVLNSRSMAGGPHTRAEISR